MAITRLIYITIDPADTDKAMQVWKKECAPLMIQQKSCITEKLLRCRNTHKPKPEFYKRFVRVAFAMKSAIRDLSSSTDGISISKAT